ncbi:hypothetical protein V6N13_043499 [Hibiscus sabdariffa]
MADTPSVTEDTPRSGFHRSDAEDKSGRGGDCSIFLEEFKEEEEGSEIMCEHVFHSGCVEKWLRINRSCPVCRFLMPTEEGASDMQMGLELMQFLVRVSRLASSIGSMALGRSQVDDGIGEESN